jgi:hypothetical protein
LNLIDFNEVAQKLLLPCYVQRNLRFVDEDPPAIRPQLEKVIASAIRRAVNQELAKLEKFAATEEERAHGRGKSAKGYDPSAIHWNREWKERFRTMRIGSRRHEMADDDA